MDPPKFIFRVPLAPEIDFAVLVICNQGGAGNKPAALACNDAIGALMKDFLPKHRETNE